MTTQQIQVEATVKTALIASGYSVYNLPYFSVKACKSTGYNSKPTGMYSIDLWGARDMHSYNKRGHFFRTKKTGEVPYDKIVDYATDRCVAQKAKAADSITAASMVELNENVTVRVRASANLTTSAYYSSYHSAHSASIINSSRILGNVKIDLGQLDVTEDQATRLLAIMSEIKPPRK